MTDQPAKQPDAYRGVYRSTPVPACVLRRDDLIHLYEELDAKGREGFQLHLAKITPNPGVDPVELEKLKSQALETYTLVMFIYGADGEQLVVTSKAHFEGQRLPEKITTVTFDSEMQPKTQHNTQPENRFRLTLDFTEPPGFDQYDPTNRPTPNTSILEITGVHSTWVAGVHESITSFIRRRGRRREWIHSHGTYNVYMWLLAIPASLWVTFRLSAVLDPRLASSHVALRGALYVYIFLFAFLLARGVAWLARWMFPQVELEGSRSVKARAAAGLVLSTLLLGLLYDVVKTLLGWP